MIKKIIFVISAAFMLFIFFSCSSNQEINIAENGDLNCRISIKITDMFASYIDDLSEAVGVEENNDNYFNIEQIKHSFKQYDYITLESAEIAERKELKLKFKVSNKGRGIGNATDSILSLVNEAGTKKLIFDFDIDKYKKIAEIFNIEENPILSRLAPYPPNPFTEEDYLDTIDYVFSEYSSDALEIMKNCSVNITISAPGKIISAPGAKISGNKAVFSIPAVKFLTLYEPIRLEAAYR